MEKTLTKVVYSSDVDFLIKELENYFSECFKQITKAMEDGSGTLNEKMKSLVSELNTTINKLQALRLVRKYTKLV